MIELIVTLTALAFQADPDAREGLRQWQPLVGSWKSTATPLDRNGRRGRDFTRTASEWVWNIGKDKAALEWKLKEGKPFKQGLLAFDANAGGYRLKLARPDGATLQFTGTAKGKALELDGEAGTEAANQRVVLEIVGENRFTLVFSTKTGDRWRKTQEIGNTREGVAFAAKNSGPECIVTGGLGTTPVVHKGKTYYVCCSGCKQAFEENPEKYIAEAKAKRKQ